MPVRTIRTPQSSSATLPMKVANNSVPDIRCVEPPCADSSAAPHDSFVTVDGKCGFKRENAGNDARGCRGGRPGIDWSPAHADRRASNENASGEDWHER